MNLLDTLKKASYVQGVEMILDSQVYNKSCSQTPIPILNLVLSGHLDGGLISGITCIAGESKTFKTLLGLVMIAAYMKTNPEAVCVFYDSEFGVPPTYLSAMGIDPARVLHVPIMNIEELKFDLVEKLELLKRGQKVCFLADSIGNLASKKEVEDAKDQKSVADMTRAKALKSLFRIVTPHFASKDIPFVFINHIYMEQGMFPKAILGGGGGPMLASDTVIIMKKVQVKEDGVVSGYDFGMFMEKSRYIKEKSRLPLSVRYDGGIDPWSGFFGLAEEFGLVFSPSRGWFSRRFIDKTTGELVAEDKKFRRADTNTSEFWKELFEKTEFAKMIQEKYCLPNIDTKPSDKSDSLFDLIEGDVVGEGTKGLGGSLEIDETGEE